MNRKRKADLWGIGSKALTGQIKSQALSDSDYRLYPGRIQCLRCGSDYMLYAVEGLCQRCRQRLEFVIRERRRSAFRRTTRGLRR